MNRLLISFILMHLSGVLGAADENLSVMEGGSVTLYVKSDEIQGAEKLVWTFNGSAIASIDKEEKTNSVPGNDAGRFKNRLKLNEETGDLTITNTKTTDSGLYQLQIIKTMNSSKNYNVTVSAITDQRSHWVITGPLLSVALILGGIIVVYKRCKNKRHNDI